MDRRGSGEGKGGDGGEEEWWRWWWRWWGVGGRRDTGHSKLTLFGCGHPSHHVTVLRTRKGQSGVYQYKSLKGKKGKEKNKREKGVEVEEEEEEKRRRRRGYL